MDGRAVVELYPCVPYQRASHNAYALHDPEGTILVEPVCAPPSARDGDERAQEKRQLAWILWGRDLVASGRRLRAIVLTHRHPDHTAGIAPVADDLNVPLLGPEDVPRKLGSWVAVDTPGHADEHVCLFDGQTMILGDALEVGDGRAHDFLDSLALLERLNPARALPSHGHALERHSLSPFVRWRLSGELGIRAL